MEITREKCVLCNNISLKTLFKYKIFPFIHCETLENFCNDLYGNLNFLLCNNCKCVQISPLIDQTYLYKNSHNNTTHSKLWLDHHFKFSDFILNNENTEEKFIEIGGYSGALAKEILNKASNIKYTIIDLCDRDPEIKDVSFINANCETFNINSVYSGKISIILSHVFEHLYNPINFIQNMYKNNVNEIFISVPNLEYCLNSNILSFIHREHTFFYTKSALIELFLSCGYHCKKSENYLNHSIFFNFCLDKIRIPNWKNIWEYDIELKFLEYFKNKEKYFYDINQKLKDKKFYLSPGGYIGQAFYFMCEEETRANILGFIDNDKTKCSQRTYGTKLNVYHPSEFNTLQNVFIYSGVYSTEILEQLSCYKIFTFL